MPVVSGQIIQALTSSALTHPHTRLPFAHPLSLPLHHPLWRHPLSPTLTPLHPLCRHPLSLTLTPFTHSDVIRSHSPSPSSPPTLTSSALTHPHTPSPTLTSSALTHPHPLHHRLWRQRDSPYIYIFRTFHSLKTQLKTNWRKCFNSYLWGSIRNFCKYFSENLLWGSPQPGENYHF